MNLIVEDLLELIQPPCVNPFYGTHTTNVVPRSDLDDERLESIGDCSANIPMILLLQSTNCFHIVWISSPTITSRTN